MKRPAPTLAIAAAIVLLSLRASPGATAQRTAPDGGSTAVATLHAVSSFINTVRQVVLPCRSRHLHMGVQPSGAVSVPLTVSLEWNTARTEALATMAVAIERAAIYLQNATDGLITIGPIDLYDNACNWANADIRVYVHNTGVPDATIGGITRAAMPAAGAAPMGVPNAVATSVSAGGAFAPGAIRVSRSWSVYGPRRGRWTDPDGFRTVVHELGHYALYLYDEYYGYDDGSHQRYDATCTRPWTAGTLDASIMYWEYSTTRFWSVMQDGLPPTCQETRQYQVWHMPDWQTINLAYPGLATKYAAEVAAGIVTDKAIVPNCGICVQPPSRWLIGFDPAGLAIDNSQPLQGDGYLAKSGGATVLHEGVPYLTMTPGTNVITTVEPLPTPAFYPPGRLEVDGGGDDDVVRATISDATGYQWQAAHRYDLPPPFNALNSVNLPLKDVQKLHAPNWYTMPLIPVIDAQPIVPPTATPAGMPMLASLRVTLSDPPIPPGPYTTPGPYTAPGANKNPDLYDTIRLYKSAVATLFEAGRGPDNLYRKTQTRLLRTASGFSGDLPLDNPKLDDPNILDGSLYVTAGERYVPPDKPAKTWALASYSLSCNSPSMYMQGHAPGDEGGLDSADGVVNVHLTQPGNAALNDFCMGFVRQPARALVPSTSMGPHIAAAPSALTMLGAAYALHGSQQLLANQAVVTFHYDRDLVPTGAPVGVTYSQLPGRAYKFQTPGIVPSCYDASAGTVVVQSGPGSPLYLDGLYQVVTLPATSPKTGPCSGRTGGGSTQG